MEDSLREVLHNLEHQKLEAIGVEKLADDSLTLVSTMVILAERTRLSKIQLMAVYSILARWLKDESCEACIEFAARIENQIYKEYQEFVATQLRKEEN